MTTPEILIALGPTVRTVPGDRDAVLILRRGVVAEIRPILDEEQVPELSTQEPTYLGDQP